MLHHGSVGRVQNATLCFPVLCWHVFCRFSFFCLFFFQYQIIKFPQQSINKSETGIGHQKLSVEPYVNSCAEKKANPPSKMTVGKSHYNRLNRVTLAALQKQDGSIDVCLGSSDALLVFDREALLYSAVQLLLTRT